MRRATQQTDLPDLPDNKEAELGLLRSIFALPEALDLPDVAAVQSADFLDLQFGTIFRHVRDAWAEGQSPEVIHARMAAAGEFDAVMRRTLFELLKHSVSGGDAAYYAEQIRESARKRRLAIRFGELRAAALNGSTADDVLASARETIDEASRGGADDVELLTAGELDAGSFATDYHIPGVLAARQPCIVAAPQKALKTSTCVDLCLSLASGTSFLGHWPARQMSVVMLSGESGLGALQRTAQRVCASKGISLADVDGFRLSTWIPRFDSASDLTKLRRLLDRTGAAVGVVDPVYLCMPGDDAGNMFAMGESLRGVSQVAQDTGTTLVLVHHMRRNIPDLYGMPELSWIAWAGFGEYARQWILSNRREPYRDDGEHRLWLRIGGSDGHGGAWGLDVSEGITSDCGGHIWATSLKPASEATKQASQARLVERLSRQEEAKAARFDRLKVRIRESLADGPKTRSQLRKAARCSGETIKLAIAEMTEGGEVEACEVATTGGAFDGVRLRVGQVGQTGLD